jgi:hypothetical protein
MAETFREGDIIGQEHIASENNRETALARACDLAGQDNRVFFNRMAPPRG